MLSAYPVALHRDGPLQMKTPGRALKRDARQENMYRVPMTVAAKSKSALTPHRPLTAKSQKTLKVKPFITISRPLGDKTPFPNRVANDAQSQTPSPLNEKLAKLSLEEPGPAIVPGALLRPSSARTSLRIPRTSGGKYEFKTPITQGNHWDVSDGDIDVEPEIQPDEQEAVQEEDYDEIEYMPPTAIIPPYEPPFEMPDYTVLGKTMWEMMHSVKFDDSADLYYAADIEIEIDVQEAWRESGFDSSPSKWERPKLPELEEDSLFPRSCTVPQDASDPAQASTSRPITRSTTAAQSQQTIRSEVKSIASSRTTRTTSAGRLAAASSSNNVAKTAVRSMTTRSTTTTASSSTDRAMTSVHTRTRSVGRDILSRPDVSAPPKTSVYATTAGPSRRGVAPSTSRSAVGAARKNPSATTATAGIPRGRTGSTSAKVASNATGSKIKVPAVVTSRQADDDLLIKFENNPATDLEEDFFFDI